MDPKKMKKLMYAAMVGSSIFSYVKKAAVAAWTPEPRCCPLCGYRMVEQIRRIPISVKNAEGKKSIAKLGFYQCGGCRAQYKATENGPFTHPTEAEWRKFVLRQRG